MILFPAIDLKDGKVVRLQRGDFSTVHQVAWDPVETATAFQEAGATHLHVVDLDGARDGVRKNAAIVAEVAKVGLKMELGGGLRSLKDLEEVFSLGVHRAVIGSAAVTDPDFVRAAVAAYGADRVAVGIDAQGGRVKTAGWEQDTGLDFIALARQMEDLGVQHIIFTDIDADGTLSGPSYGMLMALQKSVGCRITASGGVSSHADLMVLRTMGLYGAIIGKAWYAGRIDLRQAIEEAGEQ